MSSLKRPTTLRAATFAAAAGLASLPAMARAEFLTALTGNSRMCDAPISDGIVNFTVYKTVDANWMNDPVFARIGAANLLVGNAIDVDTRFVFLWQVVNDNPTGDANPALVTLRVPLGRDGAFSSIGYFQDTIFVDSAGNVGPVGNQRLGAMAGSADAGAQDGDDARDGVPSEGNVAAPTFKIRAEAVDPSNAAINDGRGTARVDWQGGASLGDSAYSSIVFMTSDSLSVAYGAGFIGQFLFADGDLPGPNGAGAPSASPEPGSFVLLALGFAGWAIRHAWRRASIS